MAPWLLSPIGAVSARCIPVKNLLDIGLIDLEQPDETGLGPTIGLYTTRTLRSIVPTYPAMRQTVRREIECEAPYRRAMRLLCQVGGPFSIGWSKRVR
jgi:hypothetical protein